MRCRALAPALVVPLALAAGLTVAPAARAQSGASQVAAAQALFNEGLALMKDDRAAEACPKFAESQQLDPGMGTQYRLADCYEKTKRTASAWVLYVEIAAAARAQKMAARLAVAEKRAAALEPLLARLKIVVPPAVAGTSGIEIQYDGRPVGQGRWGTAVPVDPGDHTVVASAPGKKTWESKITVAEGDALASVTIPALEPQPVAAPPVIAPPPPPPPPPPQHRSLAPGLALGGVAAVVLGGGSVFLTMALSNKSEATKINGLISGAKGSCVMGAVNYDSRPGRCDTLPKDVQKFVTYNDVAVGAFLVGGVAAVGTVLYFLVPAKVLPSRLMDFRMAPMVGAGDGGVVVSGSF